MMDIAPTEALPESLSDASFSPSFSIFQKDPRTLARRGELRLKNGKVQTPVFMPVGTHGTVRGIPAHDLERSGSEIMLCNTYHLRVRPGLEQIKKLGGLHRFNSWKRPILTDSGGFQVFSLAEKRKMTEEGVEFTNPRNGDRIFLSPEKVIELQEGFGSDIMMVLDECPPATATEFEVKKAVELSSRWAERAQRARTRKDLALFAIIQGGSYPELRKQSLRELLEVENRIRPWDGIAIGGMSVGEEKSKFIQTLYDFRGLLPEDRARYLMGVGTPRDLVFAVACGVDMFDCVLPSRNGRHGIVMTKQGRLNLFNERFRDDPLPLDENCSCPTCSRYSRSFIRHLFSIEDTLGGQLATLHNIYYFLDLMKEIRAHIEAGTFLDFALDFLKDPRHRFLGAEADFQSYPQSYLL